MFVSLFTAYIKEKLIINKVILKSLKNEPLGNIGVKFIIKKLGSQLEYNFYSQLFSNYSEH